MFSCKRILKLCPEIHDGNTDKLRKFLTFHSSSLGVSPSQIEGNTIFCNPGLTLSPGLYDSTDRLNSFS